MATMAQTVKRMCVQLAERVGWLYQVRDDLVFSFLSEANELTAIQKDGEFGAVDAHRPTSSLMMPPRNEAATNDDLFASPEVKVSPFRSYRRSIARVKLKLEWKDREGLHSAFAITVDVSASGCMAVTGVALPIHQKLTIIVIESGRSAQGELVWRANKGWDVGIALTKPDASFWGVPVDPHVQTRPQKAFKETPVSLFTTKRPS